ncbi:MAG: hypothetical protein OXC19_03510 [Bryobacterales bacterium]|nr:hypothetical protein [Bryobacterales bacterium]
MKRRLLLLPALGLWQNAYTQVHCGISPRRGVLISTPLRAH